MGVAIVKYPRILSSSAICGMRKALEVLEESVRTGKVFDRPDLAIDFEELTALMGLPEIRNLENRFLTKEVLAEKYAKKWFVKEETLQDFYISRLAFQGWHRP